MKISFCGHRSFLQNRKLRITLGHITMSSSVPSTQEAFNSIIIQNSGSLYSLNGPKSLRWHIGIHGSPLAAAMPTVLLGTLPAGFAILILLVLRIILGIIIGSHIMILTPMFETLRLIESASAKSPFQSTRFLGIPPKKRKTKFHFSFFFFLFFLFFSMRAPRDGDTPMGGSPPVRAPGRSAL